jgi:predicted Na+-dependent transporter
MQIIRRFFGLFLLVSCGIGMLVPSFGDITPYLVMVSLAFIIFCSYFQIDFEFEKFRTDTWLSLKFFVLRFVIVPVVIFFLFKWISDFYSIMLLLMFLLPAAVSSPSFTIIFGGKPDLSLKLLIYSSFLSVITIPVLMGTLPGPLVQVNAGRMLLTMVYTIVIPFIVHLPLRKVKSFRHLIIHYNSLFTLIGLALIFIAATARNRPAILANPELVALYALVSLVLYALLYGLGFMILTRRSRSEKLTFSISSGANNIGLGVTITALFFPGHMNVFFIVAQLAWVVALIPLRRVFGKAG